MLAVAGAAQARPGECARGWIRAQISAESVSTRTLGVCQIMFKPIESIPTSALAAGFHGEPAKRVQEAIVEYVIYYGLRGVGAAG